MEQVFWQGPLTSFSRSEVLNQGGGNFALTEIVASQGEPHSAEKFKSDNGPDNFVPTSDC